MPKFYLLFVAVLGSVSQALRSTTMASSTNPQLTFTIPLENLTASTNLFRTVSADVEVESVSDATVSDMMGPGRTVGTWISKAGRGVERLVDQVATKVVAGRKRRPDPASQSMDSPPLPLTSPRSSSAVSLTLSLGDIPALKDVLPSASVDFEALSDSDGSLSDQMGPGRTLGRWLSHSGGKLKQVMGGAAERLGLGPNAVMAEILSRANHHALIRKADSDSRSFMRSPPPFSTLLWEISGKGDIENGVLMLDDKLIDGYRKLVELLRDKNQSNKLIAIYYIVALTCAFLDSQAVFLDLGALEIVQSIYTYSTMLPLRHRDRDLLLVPSRRALVVLSESHILASVKEYSQVPWFPPVANRVHLSHLLSVLVPYTTTPNSQLLAIQRLAAMCPLGDNISVFIDQLTPEIMFQWFVYSLSMDPFERSVFLSFIRRLLKEAFQRPSSDLWHWRCFLLPACQVYMRHPKAAFGDPIATELLRMHSDPQSSRFTAYLAATLTAETRTSLQRLVDSRVSSGSTTLLNDHQWLSVVTWFGSPFFALWGAWNRCWYFQSSNVADGTPFIRAVPSRKQTRLCEELVELVLHDRCSLEDVARVIEADDDCLHEILRLLNISIHSSTLQLRYRVEAKALSQKLVAWNQSRPHKFDKKETIIYRGVCVRDDFYPDSSGCIKVFTAPSGVTRKGQYSTKEVLYADRRFMRWVSAREIRTLDPRYQLIVVNEAQDIEQEFIGCVWSPHRHVFSVRKSLDLPDGLSGGHLHILAARLTVDGSMPYHWRDIPRTIWL
ncbi:hypothetical protein JAAARDRAFT_63588 [Jaapia argillacea MUCL 33604]|uniref:Uncharacterized protein n=1 Tax=Jaapia argillacea MUCL 33604 TaxID=933084 RepID=A0A067P746_9AGAM|nr:hypothetical protein JAAARDRAFT_63588 [Jaapia argillacea MUCL 33604]